MPPSVNMATSPPDSGVAGVRLRAFATFLLVVMAALLAFSTWAMRVVHPEFVWLQAFSEAALVGGLADWFAVTALFRHPMGVPVPHTAIIPRSKDRIGDTLAAFLRTNFLTPRIVARRLEHFDAATAVAGFLDQPTAGGRVRQASVRLVAQLADTPAGQSVLAIMHRGAMRRLEDTEISPLLGRVLEAMMSEGRHVPVINTLIAWARRTLDTQEGLIRSMVEERTGWILRMIRIDEKLADAIVDGLRGLLEDLDDDPEHPVREKAENGLRKLAQQLQDDPELREKVEQLKRELVTNQAVSDWVEGMWAQARQWLFELLEGDWSGAVTTSMADALRTDQTLRNGINQLARRAVVGIAADHGDSIVRLVSDTIKSWDTATVTEKLESAVTRDLQYIRLNGTLIGGSIGLVLHAVLTYGPTLFAR